MFNKKIIVCLFVLLFLSCGVVSAFDLFGDSYTYDDIRIGGFTAGVSDYSSAGEVDYGYYANYFLEQVSSSLEGSQIVTYFYSGDELVEFDDGRSVCNNSTMIIDTDSAVDGNDYVVGILLHSKELVNVTHVKIVVIEKGKVVFNATHSFSMDNAKKFGSNNDKSAVDTSDSSSHQYTYVASTNSDKFHEPYCSQAQRINDANKITFSSREEAINAGYEPCNICYP